MAKYLARDYQSYSNYLGIVIAEPEDDKCPMHPWAVARRAVTKIAWMDRTFEPPFSTTGVISQDRESCQFPFLIDKNPRLYQAARPGSSRRRAKCFLWRRSLELRASGAVVCVGNRFWVSDCLE